MLDSAQIVTAYHRHGRCHLMDAALALATCMRKWDAVTFFASLGASQLDSCWGFAQVRFHFQATATRPVLSNWFLLAPDVPGYLSAEFDLAAAV